MSDPSDARVQSSALGAVLGALTGDAAGAVLEFLGRPVEEADVAHAMALPGGGTWEVAPGQITDDGELTMCLLRAAAESKRASDLADVAASFYAQWIASGPFDIGATTSASLGCLAHATWAERAKHVGLAATMTEAARARCTASKANGSLMRATPLGVFGVSRSNDDVILAARADARMSHPNDACVDATTAYALAIATVVREAASASAVDRRADAAIDVARSFLRAHGSAETTGWLDEALAGIEVPYAPQIGFVRIAFTHAFRHFARGTSYVDAIRETLLGGGDTDTNACIVGGLLGARDGEGAIPAAMRARVLSADLSLGKNPRPEFLHPRDVPSLVARLF